MFYLVKTFREDLVRLFKCFNQTNAANQLSLDPSTKMSTIETVDQRKRLKPCFLNIITGNICMPIFDTINNEHTIWSIGLYFNIFTAD